MFERIQVTLNGRKWDTACCRSLCEHLRIVDALRSGHNLLAADEQIVRVRPARVLGVRHRVERACRLWILVHHVKVSAVLLSDQLSQSLLIGSGDILISRSRNASIIEHLNAFLEGEAQTWAQVLERLYWILLSDQVELVLKLISNAVEDVSEEATHDIKHFVVMLINCHFKIKPSELTQMSMSVGIFSAEHRTNLKHTFKSTTRGSNLLIKLR
mmetsp:Transcript_113153/g.221874  ORF Transcript_113153/g.221874 Transcript_113153/m.221874 type:complete len:214 (+) Transcript_113153:215-856(+)